MQNLKELIKDSSFLSEQELEIISIVLNAINEPFKSLVIFEFERQTMFDTRKQTRQILLNRLQEIILNIADKKAKSAELKTNGEFVTNYEALRYKRLFFIAEILNIKDSNICYFLKDLRAKALL